MTKIIFTMFLFFSVTYYSARTLTTIGNNTWSEDGVNSCSCTVSANDTLVINHNMVFTSSLSFAGKLTINSGGDLTANQELNFNAGASIEINTGGELEFKAISNTTYDQVC